MPRRPIGSSGVEFEGLAFQVEPRRERAEIVARRVVRRAFPSQRWRIDPLERRKGEFQAVPAVKSRARLRRVDAGAAWELSYRLRKQPEVAYAEPLFTVPTVEQHVPPPAVRIARGGTDTDDPGTDGNYEWSLKKMFVSEAWTLFANAKPGEGVRVGHPDTGYTPHPEIAGPRLLTSEGFDFEEDDADATDTLDAGPLRNPGHGTGTASVIISNAGKPTGSADDAFVSGVAPFASLVPLRTTRSVVLWSMSRLVKAIRYAVDHGCHVVSISLGGPASRALHSAVQDAEAAGVIVLCAAGNQVRFVVFPAAFDEVIAVAASTIRDEPWSGSCRGPAVDITAPGASVWRAEVARDHAGTLTYMVKRGSGTSFAVAATAGLAALWLSYHGRAALIAKYGKAGLASVFKQILQATCRVPSGWNTGSFGAGVVHAKRLLEAPLPSVPRARGLRGLQRRTVSIEDDVLERLVHLLTPAPRSAVVKTMADVLRVDEESLPEVLHEVGDEMAFNIAVDPALRARLVAASSGVAGVRRARAGRAGAAVVAARRRFVAQGSRPLRSRMVNR